MYKKSVLSVLLSVFILSCSSESREIKPENIVTTDVSKINNQSKRIVAIGDIHGDLDAARKALKLAGAIDNNDNWIAKDLTLVQTGDQIDRGDHDKEIIDLFEKLEKQAPKYNSKIYQLNGNHEIMNASGDMRYVTEKSFEAFKGLNVNISNPILNKVPQNQKYRYAAFLPGGLYAQKLATRNTVLKLGDNVFVHGGILPKHIDYGIDKINQEVKDWLSNGKTPVPPDSVRAEDSVVWTRIYADEEKESDCQTLKQMLTMLNAKRLIVGHTVHSEGITPECDNTVWRIDVGMSKAYGGPIQALEIDNDNLKVLK